MATYIDKTHNVKKIHGRWVPQWKTGFLGLTWLPNRGIKTQEASL